MGDGKGPQQSFRAAALAPGSVEGLAQKGWDRTPGHIAPDPQVETCGKGPSQALLCGSVLWFCRDPAATQPRAPSLRGALLSTAFTLFRVHSFLQGEFSVPEWEAGIRASGRRKKIFLY